MSYTAKKLIALAIAEIGYREKETNSQLDNPTANAGDGNYTKYARDLHAAGYYQANKNGYAWCDMFVDWLFYKLTGSKEKGEYLECQTGLYGAGCEWSSDCYRRAGRFDKNPQPGDQIFFGKTDAEEHTGIVEKVENGKVHTIEGNSSNRVQRCTYSLTSSKIVGYGHPRFDADDASEEETTGDTTPVQKTVDELAKEVLNGEWGNGSERKERLTAAGYDYSAVQARVNELVKGTSAPAPQKTIDELAKEVLNGDWGNGSDRKERLTAAGYDYAAVQARVNELVAAKNLKSTDEVAREVIRGLWGNGSERKKKLREAGYDYATIQKRVNELLS